MTKDKITSAHLLRLFLDADIYRKYGGLVNKNGLAQEARIILEEIGNYLRTADTIELDKFVTWFHQCARPDLSRSQHELYTSIFEHIAAIEEADLPEVLQKFEEEGFKELMYEEFKKPRLDVNKVLGELEQLKSKIATTSLVEGEAPNDLSMIFETSRQKGGWTWRLDCLNKGIGSLSQGTFMLIFGDVESGKTSFCASEMTHIARQLEEGSVIWLNNEQSNAEVWKRIYSAALKLPIETVEKFPRKAMATLKKLWHGRLDRIRLFDIEGKKLQEIEHIVRSCDAKLIIIDIIDKLKGGGHTGKDGAEHLRLKNLYGMARRLAKDVAPVIGVCQADASASWVDWKTKEIVRQKWLDKKQLSGSKVDKPGELDVVLGIGQDINYPRSRYLHVSKNKMSSIEETWRYFKQEVYFDNVVCRYENPR